MSGQPTFFYTYEARGTEHETFNWFATQALADAGAASAGRLANVGAVAVPHQWSQGLIRDPLTDAWRSLRASDLDDLGQRVGAATALYAALDGFLDGLPRIVAPSKDVARVQDIISMARWGAFLTFTAGTWTGAQQITWAKAAMLGPTDGETTQALIRAAHGLTDAQAPGGAFAWVDPETAVRVALSEAEAGSVRWFAGLDRDLTMTDVDGDGWIQRMD